MLSQNEIQKIAQRQTQIKKNGATFLTIAGTALVTIACWGMVFTNNIDYVVVLLFGFIVAMFGFMGLKE